MKLIETRQIVFGLGLALFASLNVAGAESSLWLRAIQNTQASGMLFPVEIEYCESIIDGVGESLGVLKLNCRLNIDSTLPVLEETKVIEGADLYDSDKREWVSLLLEHMGIDIPFFIENTDPVLLGQVDHPKAIRGVNCAGFEFKTEKNKQVVKGTVWIHPDEALPMRIESRLSDPTINVQGNDLVHFNWVIDFENDKIGWRPIRAVENGWFEESGFWSSKLVVHMVELRFSKHQRFRF